MSALPPFDRAAIEAHVSLLHDMAEGLEGVLILAAFEAGGKAQVQRFMIGDAAGMVETIMGFENHPKINVYAPWSVFRRDLEPGKKGAEADVVAVLAAVPDLDNDKYTISELPVEAPYVVESSPGNFQPVYVFERPLAAADAKPVLAALSDFIGGDSGTKDCSHVWRIPGTLNIPTKSKLMRGRSPVPAAVTIKKHFDGRLIDPATLLALAPPPRLPNGRDSTPDGPLSFAEEARLRSALAAIPADDRDTWLKVGAALHLLGARTAWADWSKTSAKFDAADQDRVWASFYGERKGGVVTIATIYGWAKERGWNPIKVNSEGFDKAVTRRQDNGNSEPEPVADVCKMNPPIRFSAATPDRTADAVELAIIRAGFPLMHRAGMLVMPFIERMQTYGGGMAQVATLRAIDQARLIDMMSRSAQWEKYSTREKKYLPAAPPEKAAAIVMSRAGEWQFPRISAIISTPTLRHDGSILSEPGYDPETQLYLAPSPDLVLPPFGNKPTQRKQAPP